MLESPPTEPCSVPAEYTGVECKMAENCAVNGGGCAACTQGALTRQPGIRSRHMFMEFGQAQAAKATQSGSYSVTVLTGCRLDGRTVDVTEGEGLRHDLRDSEGTGDSQQDVHTKIGCLHAILLLLGLHN